MEFRESQIHSLGDYLTFCLKNYDLTFWIGARLLPYDFKKNRCEWVLFTVNLPQGYYRLCLMLVSEWKLRPIRAYGVAFAPDEKIPKKLEIQSIGYDFKMSPAVADGNHFFLTRNVSDFQAHKDGNYRVGVTTKYWSEDAADTCFEVMLLRKRSS